MDLEERQKHGELTSADSIHVADSLKFKTLRKGRTVYGGGGIIPDYFIPVNTTRYTKWHRELTAKGAINASLLHYMDSHRAQLRQDYPQFDQFKAGFSVPDALVDLLCAEGEKMGITPSDDAEREKALPEIRLQLKALLARDLWGMSEYFAVINDGNPSVQRAIELLTPPSRK